MVFLCNLNGEISVLNEAVNQNSNKANRIILLAPFSNTQVVNVAFNLPNGVNTAKNLMTYVRAMPINIRGEEIELNAWELSVPVSVTSTYGKVGLQFYVTNADGNVVTTALSSFIVTKGVEDVTPTPTTDIYQEIIEMIAEIQAKLEEGLTKIQDYSNNATYNKGNVVYYNGNIYIATQDDFIDKLPTNTSYWKIVTDISGKVDKVSTASQYIRAYVVTTGGTQAVHSITPNLVSGTIVSRDLYGRFKSATPIENNDVANKEFVEDKIEEVKNNPDVVDIVQTKADLLAYDTSKLGNNDIIRVLKDETYGDASTYYRWNKTSQVWTYVGSLDYYSKGEADLIFSTKGELDSTAQSLYNQLTTYTDNAVENKVDKYTGMGYRVYVHTPTGDDTVNYAQSAIAGDIPQRATNGNIIGPEVGKITDDKYYATKEYVDNKYLLLNIADEIQIGGIDGAFCPNLTSAQISQIYTAYTQGKKVRVQTTTDTRRYYDVLICNDFSCTLLAQQGYVIEYFSFGGEVSIETHSTIYNKDLNAQGLYTGNSYYRHIGTTSANFIHGVIYFYSNGSFKAIDGSGSGGDMTLKVHTTGTMQTSTLPAITVPALTEQQISNITTAISQGKYVVIDNDYGQFAVSESDSDINGIRFTYYGYYLDYYVDGSTVTATYIKLDTELKNVATSQASFTIEDGKIFRYNTITTLSLNAPTSYAIDFMCAIYFTTGATISMDYSSILAKWTGDDVSSGVFVPKANKQYQIVFFNSGNNGTAKIQAVVRGVSND